MKNKISLTDEYMILNSPLLQMIQIILWEKRNIWCYGFMEFKSNMHSLFWPNSFIKEVSRVHYFYICPSVWLWLNFIPSLGNFLDSQIELPGLQLDLNNTAVCQRNGVERDSLI